MNISPILKFCWPTFLFLVLFKNNHYHIKVLWGTDCHLRR